MFDCPRCGKPLRKLFDKEKHRYQFVCNAVGGCGTRVPIGADGRPVRFHPPNAAVRCPKCGAPMRYVSGARYGDFWSCTRHPDCTGTVNILDPSLGPVPENLAPYCPADPAHGRMVRRTGPNGAFFGCPQYPNCRKTLSATPDEPSSHNSRVERATRQPQDISSHHMCSLEQANISSRTARLLRNHGINTLSDLAASSAHDILNIPGAGPALLTEVELALNRHGLTFSLRR